MKLVTSEERLTTRAINGAVKLLNEGKASKGATIRTLFAGGLSVKEISQVSGIKYNHVYNVAKSEVYKNGWQTENTGREGGTKKAAILALLEEGKTIAEVSQELRCLYNQVWQVAKANGYTNKQKQAMEGGAQ
ncbi:MAG: hypothetical protein R3Y58_02085 [Eubacteriales bacterium]